MIAFDIWIILPLLPLLCLLVWAIIRPEAKP
jgi:hypothetical protein